MFVVTVTFRSEPEKSAEFLAALRENAALSVSDEPGCQRFDVCRNPKEPAEFFLYEVYDDAAAFAAHKATPHYRDFNRQVGEWTVEKSVSTFVLDEGAEP